MLTWSSARIHSTVHPATMAMSPLFRTSNIAQQSTCLSLSLSENLCCTGCANHAAICRERYKPVIERYCSKMLKFETAFDPDRADRRETGHSVSLIMIIVHLNN